MALNLDPQWREPIRRDGEGQAAEPAELRRITRNGVEQLAHGALVCPECAAPIVLAEAMPAGARLECGFCAHTARAREFVVTESFDALANEVYLIARLAG